VDRYTQLRATSSMERHCATIDNKGGGEGVRERFVLGGKGDTQIYIVYIEGDVETEGIPPPAEKRRVRVGIYQITQENNVSIGGIRDAGGEGR
jgi:hypothetical protein